MQRVDKKRDDTGMLQNGILRPGQFATMLHILTTDCEALLGIFDWFPGFRTWRGYHAVIDRSTPLVAVGEGGAALLIPKWRLLKSAELLIFYRDGSILQVFLGRGNYIILSQGSRQIARERIGAAKRMLRETRQDFLLYSSVLLGLVIAALGLFLPAFREAGSMSKELSSEGWGLILGGLVVCAMGGKRFGLQPTLPRERMVTTVKQGWAATYSSLVQGVLRLKWSVEDVRRLLTAIVAAVIATILFKACS